MKLLISACLLGVDCRYDGGTKPLEKSVISALMSKYELVPICPEMLGGLPSPRLPSERRGEAIVSSAGDDVTENFLRGARQALHLAELFGCRIALLKERSPSCGHGEIYDGSFSGRLVPGSGAAAELLEQAGIEIYGESRVNELI